MPKSALETRWRSAILARMNAFRVTIILLLAAVVGLMFYVLAVYLPDQREQYSVYQAMKNKESWDRRQEEHDRRLRQYGPGAESAEEEQARKAAEQHSAELDKKLNEAEERSVLEEAQRREEAARAAADAAEEAKAAAPKPLGVVASVDKEWNIILCSPAGACPENGSVVAVVRDERVVCEATVDGQDPESGQFSATLRPVAVPQGDTSVDTSKFTPQVGDAVIVSPLINVDSSMDSYVNPHANPAPNIPTGNSAPEEIESALIPIP